VTGRLNFDPRSPSSSGRRQFLVFRRVLDHDVEHEPAAAALRERVGAFELNRVLGREHEERLVQRVGAALNRTRCSCIASSSAACVFGGVRLISSASTMFANTGPGAKHLRRPCRVFLMMSVPVMSEGIGRA
jgi:hypothetical protein